MASKRPQRPNLTSELKSMAQVTYYSMLILPVLAFLWPDFQLREKKKIKNKKIAAGKNGFFKCNFPRRWLDVSEGGSKDCYKIHWQREEGKKIPDFNIYTHVGCKILSIRREKGARPLIRSIESKSKLNSQSDGLT